MIIKIDYLLKTLRESKKRGVKFIDIREVTDSPFSTQPVIRISEVGNDNGLIIEQLNDDTEE